MASHVLLIEDEPNIAEAIRFILSRDGWQVSTMADGIGAAQAVREARHDLVILDLMLPGCSGLEVLEAIRADPVTEAVPVLKLTVGWRISNSVRPRRCAVEASSGMSASR